MMRTCSICPEKHRIGGYCRKHFARWKKWGDPLAFGRCPKGAPIHEYMEAFLEDDPVTGCWNWTGYITPQGYGHTRASGHAEQAHRLAWKLSMGDVEPHMAVCHKCDNRRCCNPDHLFIGTRAENQQDMARKNRSPQGERNARAKFTADQVLAIRADTRPAKEIAADYGTTCSYVRDLQGRNRWRHLLTPDAST